MFSIYCIRELFPYILLNSKTRIHPRIPYIAFPVQAWDSGPSIFCGNGIRGPCFNWVDSYKSHTLTQHYLILFAKF